MEMGKCQWGKMAFEWVVKLDNSKGPIYVLMTNIYAAAGMGQKAGSIDAMRIRNRPWKNLWRNLWIGSSNVIPMFSFGDTKHAQSKCLMQS